MNRVELENEINRHCYNRYSTDRVLSLLDYEIKKAIDDLSRFIVILSDENKCLNETCDEYSNENESLRSEIDRLNKELGSYPNW